MDIVYNIRTVSELLSGFKEVLILMPSYWELKSLAEVVADIALIEVQLGEVQQRTDKVLGKVVRDEYPTVLDIKGA